MVCKASKQRTQCPPLSCSQMCRGSSMWIAPWRSVLLLTCSALSVCTCLCRIRARRKDEFLSCSFGTPRDVCAAEQGEAQNEPVCSSASRRKQLPGSSVEQECAIPPLAQLLALLQLLQQTDKSQHSPKSQLFLPLSSAQGAAYKVLHVPEVQRD